MCRKFGFGCTSMCQGERFADSVGSQWQKTNWGRPTVA